MHPNQKASPEMVRNSRAQTITTKYLAPTNNRGARVKATNSAGISVTVAWDYGIEDHDNHDNAARALLNKLEWAGGEWIGGANGTGSFVYVMGAVACETYSSNELARIPAGESVKVKFYSESGADTKHLNLNAESAAAIRAFLTKLGF